MSEFCKKDGNSNSPRYHSNRSSLQLLSDTNGTNGLLAESRLSHTCHNQFDPVLRHMNDSISITMFLTINIINLCWI